MSLGRWAPQAAKDELFREHRSRLLVSKQPYSDQPRFRWTPPRSGGPRGQAAPKGRKATAGTTFWLYLLLYATTRFIIEFYRGDPRGSVGMFSTSQFISLLLGPLSLAMLIWLRRAGASDAGPGDAGSARPSKTRATA